jgi:hypothetical protein
VDQVALAVLGGVVSGLVGGYVGGSLAIRIGIRVQVGSGNKQRTSGADSPIVGRDLSGKERALLEATHLWPQLAHSRPRFQRWFGIPRGG